MGLPLHPLIIHATVVFVPLAAAAVAAAVLWPWFRHWAGPIPVGLSLVALILTPLTTATGENLQKERDPPDGPPALAEAHAELGDPLIIFTLLLFLVAAAYWWLDRRATGAPVWPPGAPATGKSATPAKQEGSARTIMTVVSVLAVVIALGTLVEVGRIGHSGAKAAWSNYKGESGGG
jgi:hypothetical protein